MIDLKNKKIIGLVIITIIIFIVSIFLGRPNQSLGPLPNTSATNCV